MKIFINDTAVMNYPLADNQDAAEVQSMLLDLSIISSTTVYMTNLWSNGEQAGGLFTNGSYGNDSCGHFNGDLRDGAVTVYNDQESPIGWVVFGPEISTVKQCTGKWMVNPTCVVAPTAVHTFSVNGVSRVYPNVLKINPTDYIQSTTNGKFIERASFANSQDLDGRDWYKEGPILSINGAMTLTGNCNVHLLVHATYSAGKILLEDASDNFTCTGTYEVRDTAIMDHADYGLSMELPLDNMVKVWNGKCPRRS